MKDQRAGCLSRSFPGYEGSKIPLILSFWVEWSKNREIPSDFVVLTATTQKAKVLKEAILTWQRYKNAQRERSQQSAEASQGQPQDMVQIDVKAAAGFLYSEPKLGLKTRKRYVVIVDTLFPDLCAWDRSVHAALPEWASRANSTSTWVRMCLLQPSPIVWHGESTSDVPRGVQPVLRRVELQDPGDSKGSEYSDRRDKIIVDALVSELDAISKTARTPSVVVACSPDNCTSFPSLLPKHILESWAICPLTCVDQQQSAYQAQQFTRCVLFFVTTGIATLDCEIPGLAAIICIDPQERPVFSKDHWFLPTVRSAMCLGEMEYCHHVLMRHATRESTPFLCQFRLPGEKSEPRRELLVDPFVSLFLIIGILEKVPLPYLEHHLNWPTIERASVCLLRLVNLALLNETPNPDRTTVYYTLRDRRVIKTFYLMVRNDRLDVGFCWLEAGLDYPPDGSVATIDTTSALCRLMALLRPRPGGVGISIDLDPEENEEENESTDQIISKRINAAFQSHLHSWLDKGAPWLFMLIFDLIDKTYRHQDHYKKPWFSLTDHICATPAFAESILSDQKRMLQKCHVGGPPFIAKNMPDPEGHVNTCYEAIIHQLLDAFPEQLVVLQTMYSSYWAIGTCSNHVYRLSPDLLNTLLLSRSMTSSEKGKAPLVFAIYFDMAIANGEAIVNNLLMVPTKVYIEWQRRSKFDKDKHLLL
ncbi:hypothetical protein GGS24DRAFT_515234 [Hypoxylon argillaceum]|nr:hypothetical protein GGS24DRAFT_515234 [Hypoxylon argillaceum]